METKKSVNGVDRKIHFEARPLRTLNLFMGYLNLQKSGKYNMITDAETVRKMLGLSVNEYATLQSNYDTLARLVKKLETLDEAIYG